MKKNLFGNYKNSYLGFAWHFFTPLLMLLVYYVVFTGIRPNSMNNYWVFLASALFPFNFMVQNLTGGTACITSNASIVKKISFPKELIPLSYVTSSLISMSLGYLAILLVIAFSGFNLSTVIMLLPLAIAINTLFVIGYVFALSAINVYIRDLQYFLTATSIVFIFTTPVYFSLEDVSGILISVSQINPMTYYINLYHDLIYYGVMPSLEAWIYSLVIATITMIIGGIVFSKMKRKLVDWL